MVRPCSVAIAHASSWLPSVGNQLVPAEEDLHLLETGCAEALVDGDACGGLARTCCAPCHGSRPVSRLARRRAAGPTFHGRHCRALGSRDAPGCAVAAAG